MGRRLSPAVVVSVACRSAFRPTPVGAIPVARLAANVTPLVLRQPRPLGSGSLSGAEHTPLAVWYVGLLGSFARFPQEHDLAESDCPAGDRKVGSVVATSSNYGGAYGAEQCDLSLVLVGVRLAGLVVEREIPTFSES